MNRNFQIKIEFPNGSSQTFNRDFSVTMSLVFDSTNDNSVPQYGIIGNTGQITVIDKNNSIINEIKQLKTNNIFKISIILNDVEIKSFKTDNNIDYDAFSKKLSFNIISELQSLQNVYTSLSLSSFSTNMVDIYTFLKEKSVGFDFNIDENVLQNIRNTNIEYSFLNYDSLWNHWNNFCNACQLQMFQDKDGIVKIIKYDGVNI